MNNATTRQMVLADLPVIYEFVCSLEEHRFEFNKFASCFALCFHNPANHYIVAEVGGVAVGYLSCHGQLLLHHCGLVYELQELYVMPEHRSKGIGKLLLAALARIIDKEDYELLELCSNMRRTHAHRFYLKNGFEQTSYKFKKTP
jgi:PhnO protein